MLGKEYRSELKAFIGELNPDEIGVELVVVSQNAKGEYNLKKTYEFKCVGFQDGVADYRATIVPDMTGAYQMAGRMYAKNKALPLRQDFELVKWL
ncbi:MAG: hypothetical protein QMB59_04290 [Bacteroidales bacterium]